MYIPVVNFVIESTYKGKGFQNTQKKSYSNNDHITLLSLDVIKTWPNFQPIHSMLGRKF